MNKIVVLLLCTYLTVYAVTIEASYDIAHKKAVDSGKILMVLLVRKNNQEDLVIIRRFLTNQKLLELIEQKAVFVIIQKGTQQTYPIEMLYTTLYPALFFLNKNELFIAETLTGDIATQKTIHLLLAH